MSTRQSDATDHSHSDHRADAHSADPLHADAPHDDQNHDRTAQTVCLLQSAAQHSHLSTAEPVSIVFLKVEFEEQLVSVAPLALTFQSLAIFSTRASDNLVLFHILVVQAPGK